VSERVLVTGADGFVGSHLVARLGRDGQEVISLTRTHGDIRNGETWDRLRGEAVSHVYHLAGKTYVPESWSDPGLFFSTNVGGTLRALEFCRATSASLTFVSAYVYGTPDRVPVSETAPARPNNPYAHSKYLAEQACRSYFEQFSLPIGIVRPFNIYGPGQDDRFLVPLILRQVRSEPEVCLDSLAPKRDFVHVDDLVEALVRTGRRRDGLAVFNVASGKSFSVSEVVRIIQQALGSSKPVLERGTARRNEIDDVVGDAQRARSELGWAPSVPLEEGLSKLARAAKDETPVSRPSSPLYRR
jgi:nucleoside-diphosphate-sugar epimerase